LRLTWLNARAAVDAEANATVLGLSQVVITKIAALEKMAENMHSIIVSDIAHV